MWTVKDVEKNKLGVPAIVQLPTHTLWGFIIEKAM
jgi:hypothetical protein